MKMHSALTAKRLSWTVVIATAALVVVMVVCAMIGAQRVSLGKVFAGPGERAGENVDYELFVRVRVPRVILAALVGAALACAGLVFQAILRNPLADPYILGISSGAGLGVIIAVLIGAGGGLAAGSRIAVFAFVGALGTVWLVWGIGHFAGRGQVTSLLLAGVVVNAFFSAVMMFLIAIAGSEQLYSTIFWLMGNITDKAGPALWAAASSTAVGVIVLFGIAQKLNVLSFGEVDARALGVDPGRVKLVAFGFSAVITATAVSLSGLVGFVGLIVPHAVRLIFGPDHRLLVPMSAIVGAAFLVAADTFARTIVAPAQLPVGVVTAMAGGPFFLVLLARYTRKVQWLSR